MIQYAYKRISSSNSPASTFKNFILNLLKCTNHTVRISKNQYNILMGENGGDNQQNKVILFIYDIAANENDSAKKIFQLETYYSAGNARIYFTIVPISDNFHFNPTILKFDRYMGYEYESPQLSFFFCQNENGYLLLFFEKDGAFNNSTFYYFSNLIINSTHKYYNTNFSSGTSSDFSTRFEASNQLKQYNGTEQGGELYTRKNRLNYNLLNGGTIDLIKNKLYSPSIEINDPLFLPFYWDCSNVEAGKFYNIPSNLVDSNDHDKCFAISAHTLIKLNNFSPINEITFNGKAYGEDGYNDVDGDTLNDIPENNSI